jgi:glycerophosphoryl diester phosphodiesterase
VVIHDFFVDKTTDGHGEVAQMTYEEIAHLDAGSHFAPDFAGTPVPTLAQVLELVGSRCRINIEIKSMDPYGNDASDAVAAVIRYANLYDQVIVSSFNPITLVKLRHLDPRIALDEMPAFFRPIWAGPPIRPEAQHPDHRLVDADYMAWARSLGAQVNTWTVNDPAEAQRLAGLGVTTLITDVPDVLIANLWGEQHG